MKPRPGINTNPAPPGGMPFEGSPEQKDSHGMIMSALGVHNKKVEETKEIILPRFAVILPDSALSEVKTYKVLTLGSTGCGKTQFIQALRTDSISAENGIGMDTAEMKIDDQCIQVWDIAGQERYRNFASQLMCGTKLLLIFDDAELGVSSLSKLTGLYGLNCPVYELHQDHVTECTLSAALDKTYSRLTVATQWEARIFMRKAFREIVQKLKTGKENHVVRSEEPIDKNKCVIL